VKVGDTAPPFGLLDQHGHEVALATLVLAGPVVLFFYPAALTPGCTKESCHFRDLQAEFAALGAQCVGISMDSVDKQQRFAEQHQLPFPLLSDPKGAVARTYGVKRPVDFLKVKRSTFVIGRDGTIKAVIASEFNTDAHADRALACLRSDQSAGGR
jgi:thioredoxin-dependent peroxiredoxin